MSDLPALPYSRQIGPSPLLDDRKRQRCRAGFFRYPLEFEDGVNQEYLQFRAGRTFHHLNRAEKLKVISATTGRLKPGGCGPERMIHAGPEIIGRMGSPLGTLRLFLRQASERTNVGALYDRTDDLPRELNPGRFCDRCDARCTGRRVCRIGGAKRHRIRHE